MVRHISGKNSGTEGAELEIKALDFMDDACSDTHLKP